MISMPIYSLQSPLRVVTWDWMEKHFLQSKLSHKPYHKDNLICKGDRFLKNLLILNGKKKIRIGASKPDYFLQANPYSERQVWNLQHPSLENSEITREFIGQEKEISPLCIPFFPQFSTSLQILWRKHWVFQMSIH